jgi:hypothetical protein
MNNDDALALVERLSAQLETTENRRKGDRDAMRISLLSTLSEIEERFGALLGRSSAGFDAVRQFSEAVSQAIQKSTTNEEA